MSSINDSYSYGAAFSALQIPQSQASSVFRGGVAPAYRRGAVTAWQMGEIKPFELGPAPSIMSNGVAQTPSISPMWSIGIAVDVTG